jgi:hypothetical protein
MLPFSFLAIQLYKQGHLHEDEEVELLRVVPHEIQDNHEAWANCEAHLVNEPRVELINNSYMKKKSEELLELARRGDAAAQYEYGGRSFLRCYNTIVCACCALRCVLREAEKKNENGNRVFVQPPSACTMLRSCALSACK